MYGKEPAKMKTIQENKCMTKHKFTSQEKTRFVIESLIIISRSKIVSHSVMQKLQLETYSQNIEMKKIIHSLNTLHLQSLLNNWR